MIVQKFKILLFSSKKFKLLYCTNIFYSDNRKLDAHTVQNVPRQNVPGTKRPKDKTSQVTNEAHYLACVAFYLTKRNGLA